MFFLNVPPGEINFPPKMDFRDLVDLNLVNLEKEQSNDLLSLPDLDFLQVDSLSEISQVESSEPDYLTEIYLDLSETSAIYFMTEVAFRGYDHGQVFFFKMECLEKMIYLYFDLYRRKVLYSFDVHISLLLTLFVHASRGTDLSEQVNSEYISAITVAYKRKTKKTLTLLTLDEPLFQEIGKYEYPPLYSQKLERLLEKKCRNRMKTVIEPSYMLLFILLREDDSWRRTSYLEEAIYNMIVNLNGMKGKLLRPETNEIKESLLKNFYGYFTSFEIRTVYEKRIEKILEEIEIRFYQILT